MNNPRWWILIGMLLWTGCKSTRSFPSTLFDALAGANRIDVNTPAQHVSEIAEAWRIRKTAKLLKTYSAGWQKPWHGAPVPELELTFYKGTNPVGSFGLGHGFLTTGAEQNWSQSLPDKDRKELLQALGLRDLGG